MAWTVETSPSGFETYDRLVKSDSAQYYRVRLRERLAGQEGFMTRVWPCASDGSGPFDANAPLSETPHSLLSVPADMNAWLENIAILSAKAAHEIYLLHLALGGITVEISP